MDPPHRSQVEAVRPSRASGSELVKAELARPSERALASDGVAVLTSAIVGFTLLPFRLIFMTDETYTPSLQD